MSRSDVAVTGEPRKISSSSTFFWKRILPPLWFAFYGAFTVAGWTGQLRGDLSRGGLVALTGIFLGLGFFLVFWSRRLEELWLDGGDLLVRRHGRWLRVPMEDVREIKETHWSRVKTVTIELRGGCPAGDSILFLPPVRPLPFLDHPLVKELNGIRGIPRSRYATRPELP